MTKIVVEVVVKLAVLTSGGDAPGMNACVRAVVRYAIKHNIEVYGIQNGYAGLVNEHIIELNRTSVSDIIQRGGTFLYTDRCPAFVDAKVQLLAKAHLDKRGIDGLIVIGGDGSFRGSLEMASNTGVKIVCIPGTIDNDLAYTDYTLGFDTAVNSVLGAINNLRDTMQSHNKVTFLEVMGRHCGDIALHAGIAGGAEYILVPEVPYSIENIAKDVLDSASRGKKSNLIVFAEGAGDMESVCAQFTALTGIIPRKTNFGYIQRGGSPGRLDRVLACQFAVEAVRQLLMGNSAIAVGIRGGKVITENIDKALSQRKMIDMDLYEMATELA